VREFHKDGVSSFVHRKPSHKFVVVKGITIFHDEAVGIFHDSCGLGQKVRNPGGDKGVTGRKPTAKTVGCIVN